MRAISDIFYKKFTFVMLVATISLFFIAAWPSSCVAQQAEGSNSVVVSTESLPLKANAGEDRNIIAGRTVLFDASATVGPINQQLEYKWEFGDGSLGEGIDVAYTYHASGTYRAILTVTSQNDVSTDEVIVSVQDKIVVLITDQSVSSERLEEIQRDGLTQGVLVVPIRDSGVNQDYLTIQNLAQQILDNKDDIIAADIIVTWTQGNVGLNSLVELSRISTFGDNQLKNFGFGTKAIVAINDQSLIASFKSAETTFQSIQPAYIIVSDSKILDDVIRIGDAENLRTGVSGTDADYQIINAYSSRGLGNLSPINFMSWAMNYMINKGVPINSLYLILMLPIMATIIAAGRQMVGIKAFGIFAPTVIALSFLATGIKYGVAVFVAIIIIGTIARLIARKFRLLYLPRMAIVLSILALSIFTMFFIGALFNKTGFIAISIFPILIMTVLTEHFVSVQIEQGYRTAIRLTIETLSLSLVGYFIGDWTTFKTTILAYPELILLTFVVNYLMGKFSGLRLTEYFRFREVFKNMNHAKRKK